MVAKIRSSTSVRYTGGVLLARTRPRRIACIATVPSPRRPLVLHYPRIARSYTVIRSSPTVPLVYASTTISSPALQASHTFPHTSARCYSSNDRPPKDPFQTRVDEARSYYRRRMAVWKRMLDEDAYGALFGASNAALKGRGWRNPMWEEVPRWMVEEFGREGKGEVKKKKVEIVRDGGGKKAAAFSDKEWENEVPEAKVVLEKSGMHRVRGQESETQKSQTQKQDAFESHQPKDLVFDPVSGRMVERQGHDKSEQEPDTAGAQAVSGSPGDKSRTRWQPTTSTPNTQNLAPRSREALSDTPPSNSNAPPAVPAAAPPRKIPSALSRLPEDDIDLLRTSDVKASMRRRSNKPSITQKQRDEERRKLERGFEEVLTNEECEKVEKPVRPVVKKVQPALDQRISPLSAEYFEILSEVQRTTAMWNESCLKWSHAIKKPQNATLSELDDMREELLKAYHQLDDWYVAWQQCIDPLNMIQHDLQSAIEQCPDTDPQKKAELVKARDEVIDTQDQLVQVNTRISDIAGILREMDLSHEGFTKTERTSSTPWAGRESLDIEEMARDLRQEARMENSREEAMLRPDSARKNADSKADQPQSSLQKSLHECGTKARNASGGAKQSAIDQIDPALSGKLQEHETKVAGSTSEYPLGYATSTETDQSEPQSRSLDEHLQDYERTVQGQPSSRRSSDPRLDTELAARFKAYETKAATSSEYPLGYDKGSSASAGPEQVENSVRTPMEYLEEYEQAARNFSSTALAGACDATQPDREPARTLKEFEEKSVSDGSYPLYNLSAPLPSASISPETAGTASSAAPTSTSSASTTPAYRYTVLTLDSPTSRELTVTHVIRSTDDISEEPSLTIASALGRLQKPNLYMPHISTDQTIVAAEERMLVLRQPATSPTANAASMTSTHEALKHDENGKDRARSVNPIDGTTIPLPGAPSGKYASPTGYVSYEDDSTPAEYEARDQAFDRARQTDAQASRRALENPPVDQKDERRGGGRRAGGASRVMVAGITGATVCYVAGVVGELLK